MSDFDSVSHQLPSSLVASVFGEVNVGRSVDHVEVDFTILTTPDTDAVGSYQTGVALDASKSMKDLYGKTYKGSPPSSVLESWRKRGWIKSVIVDGKQVSKLSAEAKAQAIAERYFELCENVIEPVAREFTAYLADGLDEDGGTTLIYWACGKTGESIEVLGDFSADECKNLPITGPNGDFGEGTFLLPAMKYFADRFADAENGIYIFVTDGRISDFDRVCDLTQEYAAGVKAGTRNPIKFVLIGVGDDIDVKQFELLDDLEAPVDLWDYKLANELRDLAEIFSELVDENEILLPASEIFDDRDQLVVSLPNGVPAKFSFKMHADSRFFELRSQGERIRQPIVVE